MAVTRRLVWGFAVTETVSWGVLFYALPVLLVPMSDDLGWSRATIVGAFSLAIVISGLLAPVVGRWLDRADPRPLITTGSAAGVVLVLAWSQVRSPLALFAVWCGIGVVKAAVLYEPAFTVLIRRCAPDHQRAILVVTLTAGLASFIFQPLTSTLATAYDWRTALVLLAAVLGIVTVPIHWLILAPEAAAPAPVPGTASRPRTAPGTTPPASATPPASTTDVRGPCPGAAPAGRPPELEDPRFWSLTAAFTASATASFTTVVLLVAYLTDQGWPLGRAAFVTGFLGAMQLPGRLAFGPLASHLPHRVLAPLLFSLPGVGLLVLMASDGGRLVWLAVVLLGVGQGAGILLRALLFADLFGTQRIGVLNGLSAVPVTTVRALAPVGASAVVGTTAGYVPVFAVLAGCSALAAGLARRAL